MKDISKIEVVTERDIDLLLLEEFNVSDSFSSWVYSVVTKNNDIPPCKGAWHSISDSVLGESDLVVIYDNGLAILIENKISAIAQPEQGLRYNARGKNGIQAGLWSRFITCMIAPNLYLHKEVDSNFYNTNLSYEEISEWFISQENTDVRSKYRSYVIKEAIEQNRRGYKATPNKVVTDFWSKYWELSMHKYPELEMKKPNKKPANSDWPDFRPSIFNKRLFIVHKLERGYVDLQIAGAADKLDFLQTLFADLKVDIEIAKAGKSAAVRVKVDSIDRFSPFESQKNIVIDGLDAARRLMNIWQKIKDKI